MVIYHHKHSETRTTNSAVPLGEIGVSAYSLRAMASVRYSCADSLGLVGCYPRKA